MDRGAALSCAALFVVLAGLTSIASSKVGEPDVDGAVAAALRQHLTDLAGTDALERKDAEFERVTLCVGGEVPLNIGAVEREFADTIVWPVPESACTSETVEGDFGMFSAITQYHDAEGREAAHLEVAGASCSNTSTCVVDIDSLGAGHRYNVRREGRTWSATEGRWRWVV